MSSIFDPRCRTPVFMMDDESIASRCGRLNGMIGSIGFSLFLIIGMIIFTVSLNKNNYKKNADGTDALDTAGKKIKDKFIWWPLVVGPVVLACVWVFVPMLSAYMNVMKFRSKKIEQQAMRKRGLTDKEIYGKQQDLYEKRMESSARIKAAQIQADAIRDSNRRR
jgi:hypothetical protein